jgi:hypothetical protein
MKIAAPTGPIVKVVDAETGEAVAGIDRPCRLHHPAGRGSKQLTVVTAADGSVRLPKQPHDPHRIHVKGKGYVWRPLDRDVRRGGGRAEPQEIHLKIAKPIIVEVMLVLPDDRRMPP